MFTTKLTKGEKKIVKKIALIQLESIRGIISGNGPEDILMFCLINDIPKEDLMGEANSSLSRYEYLLENPEDILMLGELDLSITRHILFNFFNSPKHAEGKKRLWRKLITRENYIGTLN
jgi:hypothetical protein